LFKTYLNSGFDKLFDNRNPTEKRSPAVDALFSKIFSDRMFRALNYNSYYYL